MLVDNLHDVRMAHVDYQTLKEEAESWSSARIECGEPRRPVEPAITTNKGIV